MPSYYQKETLFGIWDLGVEEMMIDEEKVTGMMIEHQKNFHQMTSPQNRGERLEEKKRPTQTNTQDEIIIRTVFL